ncbi:MAG TPA: hypothetical protein VF680_09440 [Allosphingosinicella sp.]|jgi:hypothetical protein
MDREAMMRCIEALRAGGTRKQAAAAAGLPARKIESWRGHDAVFRYACLLAMELHDLEQGQAKVLAALQFGGGGGSDAPHIAPNSNRPLQRRSSKRLKFNETRQQAFLNHFAATADANASAAAAGVCIATVNKRRRKHPDFAAAWQEALTHAVALLEAEAVRQRLQAQQRLSDNLEPSGEMAQEFERVMKLLARWDRKGGGVGPRSRAPLAKEAWTFEQAIEALEKRLRALGHLKDGDLPPEDGGDLLPGGEGELPTRIAGPLPGETP